ncbi:unnamed protein product [Lactuca virosa]|uniref:Phosphofructokinase domain-containing protein n=1 Tax=Lactuca virosa TaxID=75947 RepID=A0AAU9PQS0_9ASTR|nr:unnamed protein product [Lactuca virosa]
MPSKLLIRILHHITSQGGTITGTSRGGYDNKKIVNSVEDPRINQVYIIGGDGTQKGAYAMYEELRRRGLKVVVIGIAKTIDYDIPIIDKSFGFDTAVEEAQRAINATDAEEESNENWFIFIAMYAAVASLDVDYCLIPEWLGHLSIVKGMVVFLNI